MQILAQAEKVKTIVRLIDVDAEARMLRFSTDVSSLPRPPGAGRPPA